MKENLRERMKNNFSIFIQFSIKVTFIYFDIQSNTWYPFLTKFVFPTLSPWILYKIYAFQQSFNKICVFHIPLSPEYWIFLDHVEISNIFRLMTDFSFKIRKSKNRNVCANFLCLGESLIWMPWILSEFHPLSFLELIHFSTNTFGEWRQS